MVRASRPRAQAVLQIAESLERAAPQHDDVGIEKSRHAEA